MARGCYIHYKKGPAGLGDRVCRKVTEESPGTMGIGWRVIPAGGNPRESATENKPLCEQSKGSRVG